MSSPSGIAETVAPEQGSILAQAAVKALATDPERQTIDYHGAWLTYGDLARVANRIRTLLAECGADSRAPVAFAPRNRPSAIAALMGLVASARTIRMMYVYQSGEALAANFARAKASVLVMDAEDFAPPVVEQLRQSGCVGIAVTQTGAEFVAGLDKVTYPIDPDAPKVPTFEMLTSGTTGPAKLWPLTYELLEKRFVSGNSVISEELLSAPPILLCYPLCNISGLYSAVPAIVAGLRIVLQDRFTLDGWIDYVKHYPMPDLYLPPVGIQMMLDADVPREALGPARLVRSGMTKLPVETQKAFEDKYGIPVVMSYGATEFGGVVIQMEYEHAIGWGQQKLGSTGRAYGEAKVRVVDAATGEPLGPRQEGLLEVLVPSIDPDWARTSDLAMIDEDEFVYILGRADSAIMRGGFKILPETIETALIQHPDIEAAAVVGVNDRRLGQVPAALIEMKPGKPALSDAELDAHVRRYVPATHVPTYWRHTKTMPRTASLKISLGDVRAAFADLKKLTHAVPHREKRTRGSI
jgi:acyl-coenzyme A synthetase/AMP-(fatty) acid ligase